MASRSGETVMQHATLNKRSCGVLMHLTSLPGNHGNGDLGRFAREFGKFLAHAGQSWWQMLPIHPIGPGDSPYSSPSAFAGNPWLIDPEPLVADGWLVREEVRPLVGTPQHRVAYPAMTRHRRALLRTAFDRFDQRRTATQTAWEQFCFVHQQWLDDYALYQALKRAHHGSAWVHWDAGTRRRRPAAMAEARRALVKEVDYERFVQFVFWRQWLSFHRQCRELGIGLIGDLPMFVNHDSSDVWAHPQLFRLDAQGMPRVVSGAPPDDGCPQGQKWGHPLYRWSAHDAEGFTWWVARFRHLMSMFDAVRVDHFLGFHRCWTIRQKDPTAEHGRWSASPGQALFEAVLPQVPRLQVIAEDLGHITPAVIKLRDRFGFLGMRILQNAFGPDARYDQPHRYPRPCVAYTGTHDNDTAVGWFKSLPRSTHRRHRGRDGLTTRQRVLAYTGTDGQDVHWDLIRLLYLSQANLVIIPTQDFLGLDSRFRMNRPGTASGNWDWRMAPALVTDNVADRLAGLAQAYERTPDRPRRANGV